MTRKTAIVLCALFLLGPGVSADPIGPAWEIVLLSDGPDHALVELSLEPAPDGAAPLLDSPLLAPTTLIGIPAAGTPTVTVLEIEPRDLPRSAICEIASVGYIRSQRVALVRFHPLRILPDDAGVEWMTRIRVRIDFATPSEPGTRSRTPVEDPHFESLLANSILNYESARQWRETRPMDGRSERTRESTAVGSHKVLVDRDGLYQLTYAELAAANVPVDTLDPRTLRLVHQGTEVRIEVTGESDESFDSSDTLLFYGTRSTGRYTDTNVYWLSWDGQSGLRMQTSDGTPSGSATVPQYFLTTAVLEEDHYYSSNAPCSTDGDVWYWEAISAYLGPETRYYATNLANIFTGAATAEIRGRLHGHSADPMHHTRTYVNGTQVGESYFNPGAEHHFEMLLDAALLTEGTNTVTLEVLNDGAFDVVLVNRFELDYRDTYAAEVDQLYFEGDFAGTWQYEVTGFSGPDLEVLDITDPLAPVRITDSNVQFDAGEYTLILEQTIAAEHHYLAQTTARRLSALAIVEDQPSDLHSSANGADLIVITHESFTPALAPLVAWREAQGLRVSAVGIQDVYDEFSGGSMDATAIRDFLAHARTDWQPPAPAYVLLVGDGHFDFKDFYGTGGPVFIPPWLEQVDPWLGERPADNRFVMLTEGDQLPDMHIGRLPARTLTETSDMVAKLLAYEQSPPVDWHGELLFVADNADEGGDYAALSDTVIGPHLPDPYTADKVYYGVTHGTTADARSDIIDFIDDGRLFIHYMGGGALQSWAAEPLFDQSSLDALTNTDRYTVALSMTDLSGNFAYPPLGDVSALAERLVRPPLKGAVASWAPTGLSIAFDYRDLSQGFFDAVFRDHLPTLGSAATQAKLDFYVANGGDHELIDMQTLFGDPATRIQRLPTLGDRVWHDADGNGVQGSGEGGLAGIVVDLHDDGACAGSLVASDTTDAHGRYDFIALAPGTYCLDFSFPPTNWSVSPQDQGSDDSLDSDADPASGRITGVSFAAEDVSWDLGLYNQPPSADDDGVYEAQAGRSLWVRAPGLIDNDDDPEGAALTAVKDTDPAHGLLELWADGSFEYVADAGYEGSDSFTYHVSDGSRDSTPATVTIGVLVDRGPQDLMVRKTDCDSDGVDDVELSWSELPGPPQYNVYYKTSPEALFEELHQEVGSPACHEDALLSPLLIYYDVQALPLP